MKDEMTITKEVFVHFIDIAYRAGYDSAWETLQRIREAAAMTEEQKEALVKMLEKKEE